MNNIIKKTSFKIAIASALLLTGTLTVFAMQPTSKELKYIELGTLQQAMTDLTKMNDTLRVQIELNSKAWNEYDIKRQELSTELFQ